jgi:thioredoxin 1
MPAETRYRDPTHVPTREEIDQQAGLVLLEFGTPWCGHCRALARFVAELLEQHPGVKHVKVEDGPGEPWA